MSETLIAYYRRKVIELQVEAAELTDTRQNTGRKQALKKMATFYIEQIEKEES